MIRTKTIHNIELLLSDNIGVTHAFTTRLGGVSQGTLSGLNLGFHRGDREENVLKNYELLGNALNIDIEKAVLTHQIHSDIVRAVTGEDPAGLDHRRYPPSDALITNTPGVTLVIFTADCTPILFHDPVTGAVGAAHAGWRGTAADIAGKTVRAMVKEYGCRPEDIRAAIGPNIGQCCFETDADVPQAMLAALGQAAMPYLLRDGEKYRVDLKGINKEFLKQAGVVHIDVSTECTMCQHHRFWSHRYTRGDRGSQGAIITREVPL